MQQLNLEESYDVVIIGAGVAGLTAAALLAKIGLSVCVLEAGAIGGGYLQGFRRKDFRFDTAIHWLNQYEPGGMICMTFDILGNDYPKAIPQKRIKRFKGKGFDYLLTNNPDDLKYQWQQEFPEDAAGLELFFKAAKKIGKSFKEFGHVFRSEETMTFFERIRNKKNLLRFALPFIPHIRYSGEKGTKKGLDKYFKSPGLRNVFSSDTELLSCLVPIGWAYYGDYQSPPKGGGQRITEWLTHVVRSFGYEVYYKCRVKEILVENGESKGVLFDHRGTEHTLKSKYVIAACDVETLYEKMLPQTAVPVKMKERLRAAELYPSSVTVSIALDCPVEQLGFNEEMVHLSGVGAPHEPRQDGNPKTTEICILAPTYRDPSLAPDGQGTLSLHMPALWDYEQQWMTERDEDGAVLRGEKYKELKTWLADILIDRVEAMVAPGLREHILFYDVATPVTHWRYSGNRGGTMMGAKPGRANMQNKIAHYQTPVRNLFLGGHWAELGGGVPIAVKAAANACLMILKQENLQAFQAFKDYMDSKISLAQLFETGLLKEYLNDWSPLPTPAEKKKVLLQQQAEKKDNEANQ